jgi:CRP-like cAMP-binding protein
MNTERLFATLSDIHPISKEYKKALGKLITPLSLPAHYMLLEAPKIAEHAYFLNDGFAMTYVFVKGQKHVESFWCSEQFIISVSSFFGQVPSKEFIQLREDSEVLCLSYADLQNLLDTFPEAHALYRLIMNQYYESSRERTRDMQQLTAAERFDKLIRNYPSIEKHVTQEDIASYLGITPQSLSRIKRRNRPS